MLYKCQKEILDNFCIMDNFFDFNMESSQARAGLNNVLQGILEKASVPER